MTSLEGSCIEHCEISGRAPKAVTSSSAFWLESWKPSSSSKQKRRKFSWPSNPTCCFWGHSSQNQLLHSAPWGAVPKGAGTSQNGGCFSLFRWSCHSIALLTVKYCALWKLLRLPSALKALVQMLRYAAFASGESYRLCHPAGVAFCDLWSAFLAR